MKIGNKEIGNGQPPYCVAELGANHGGNLDRCLTMIEVAKRSGADAVKLQCYEADTITLDCNREEFFIKEGPWKGRRLWDLYKKCETPFEWFPKIAARAEAVGITWFASVFCQESVRVLERLGCQAYKIASFEITDLPLIRYAALTGKPIIISTGMANPYDILKVLGMLAPEVLKEQAQAPVLLHCVSEYPAKASDYNLSKMNKYTTLYGVSDHTLGLEVPIAATALGACMIEKHFMLDDPTLPYGLMEDSEFSLMPAAFARMVKAVHETWAAMQPSEEIESEKVHKPYRRSLFVVKDVRKGEKFSYENVRSIRPGNGWPPEMIDKVVGRTATRDIERGEPLRMEMFDE